METQRIADALPPLYGTLLPRFFEKEIPRETAATCAWCAMGGETRPSSVFGFSFSRESKCCTHHPNLPNYLVGALLSDSSPQNEAGRDRVREAIRRGVGVSPRGIHRSRKIDLLIRNSDRGFFGRSRSLICPFFEREMGICTVRPFWDAVCNTWFCKYVGGQDGMSFWLAIRRYLLWAEETLIRYSLRELDCKMETIIPRGEGKASLCVEELDGSPPDEETRLALWGKWSGREEDLFRESFARVAGLNRRRFVRLAGVTESILLDHVRERYAVLARPRLPGVLLRNPNLRHERTEDGAYVLAGYSYLDPFQVSERVYRLLDFFDGRRPNAEACRLVHEQMGIYPDDELLTELYRFRILVSGESTREEGLSGPNPS